MARPTLKSNNMGERQSMTNSALQKRLTGLLVNALAASGKCAEDDLIPTTEFITGFIKKKIIK